MSMKFSWRIPSFPERVPSKRAVYGARFDSYLLAVDCLDLNKQKIHCMVWGFSDCVSAKLNLHVLVTSSDTYKS